MSTTDNQDQAAIWVEPKDLRPWRANPRENEQAVPEVAKSIERFGFASPIIARKTSKGLEVIAGHTRLKAAKSLGLERVPVRVMDLDEDQAKLLALADNKVAEIATWSDDLGDLLREMDQDGLDVTDLGWSEAELLSLIRPDTFDPAPTDDDVPDLEEDADTKRGQTYQLGPHVLICGDSMEPEIWKPYRVDVLMTDPPYCSGGKQESARNQGSVGRIGQNWRDIERDNLTTDGLVVLLERVIRNVDALKSAWVFCDWRQLQNVRRTVEPLGYAYRSLVVWDKGGGGMGWPFFHTYELVYCGIRDWQKTEGGGKISDIIHEPRTKNEHHTTQKPVAVLRRLIDATVGDVIADPFGGSGTTLLAAAQAGRKAVICEFDPRYCDVIRRRWTRWAEANGQDPGPGALS
jgi:DNA modification methylase